MNAVAESRPAPGARFQKVVSLFVGAVLLVGGGGAFYSAIPGARLAASYNGAVPCASVAQAIAGDACRYSGQAQILTGPDFDNRVSLQLDGNPDRTFVASFPNPVDPGVYAHQVVSVELWSGNVTRLAGVPTSDDPETSGNWGDALTLAGICAALGLVLIIWGIRRRRDDDDAGAPEPGLAPVSVAGTIFNQ